MSPASAKALLPAGLADVLPPQAAFEVRTVERLIAGFARRGYDRVKPPLIEFEDGILAGNGAAMAAETFRLMDPVSQRMLAVRSDITLQIARIATTRLARAPRPLRLSYAGQVLRVRGTALRPERQFGQVGVELIGSAEPAADVEAIVLAAEGLADLGIGGLSVDLGMPPLIPALAAALGLDQAARVRLRAALDRKDAAAVRGLAASIGPQAAQRMAALMAAAGPFERALPKLLALDLPGEAGRLRDELLDVARRVRARLKRLAITLDPVENRGFEYHTGVTTAFFARDARGELGRGGRYLAGEGRAAEPATGFTLFTDMLLAAMPADRPAPRLFVPAGTPSAKVARLHRQGWVTVSGLAAADDPQAEARRMGCSHWLAGDRPRPVRAARAKRKRSG